MMNNRRSQCPITGNRRQRRCRGQKVDFEATPSTPLEAKFSDVLKEEISFGKTKT